MFTACLLLLLALGDFPASLQRCAPKEKKDEAVLLCAVFTECCSAVWRKLRVACRPANNQEKRLSIVDR